MTTQTRIVAHENAGRRYLLVEVPDALGYAGISPSHTRILLFNQSEQLIQTINIPYANKWLILGIAGEMWEDVAKRVVVKQDCPTFNGKQAYENPLRGAAHYHTVATDALNSLIRSHSLTPSTCLVLRKK